MTSLAKLSSVVRNAVLVAITPAPAVELTDAEVENIDIILRVYVPDMEKMKTWQPPKAVKLVR